MFLINESQSCFRTAPLSKDYVFLDRDGVINVDSGYVGRWQDFRFIDGSLEAMKTLSDNDFELVIVTNQSGIGRGLFSERAFLDLSLQMLEYLNQQKIFVQSVYYCPHYIDSDQLRYAKKCYCRKPEPGLILAAAATYSVDLSRAFMIGDKLTDIQAAKAAKVGTCYFICPSGEPEGIVGHSADGCFPNLMESVPNVLKSRASN